MVLALLLTIPSRISAQAIEQSRASISVPLEVNRGRVFPSQSTNSHSSPDAYDFSGLPNFKLPYSESGNGEVHWSGGPHGYNEGGDLTGIYAAGEGSGLDFAKHGQSFSVLAMASGIVEDVSCGNDSFGCQVALRHQGGSVLIYAHLEPRSIETLKKEFDRTEGAVLVVQGEVIGKAGKSGGQDDIHLHIELRDGGDNCYINCSNTRKLWGNPIGWDDGLPLVDDYQIFGYRTDGEGLTLYNYDGSAVKGDNTKLITDFKYNDSGYVNTAIATVDKNFECASGTNDCENNNNGSEFTRFAGHGIFSDSEGEGTNQTFFSSPLHNSSKSSNSFHGSYLISTNASIWSIGQPPDDEDCAAFISDITLPDNTVVSPNQSLIKTWRVRNDGSTTWGNGYQLVFQSGDQMQAPSTVALPNAAPGDVVDISVNLTAPSEGGDYRGDWRLRNPQGTYFGDELWVQITVPDDPDPPPSDQPPIELTCTNCPAVVAPGETFRPTIRATVNSGQLLGSRGDMLRNTDDNLYGAWEHVAVSGAAYAGETYDFTFYADNPIIAPDSEGAYESKWRVWRDGNWASDEFTIRFEVESTGSTNYAPNPPTLTGPGDWAVYEGNEDITLEAQHNGDPDGDSVTHYYFEIFESAQNANSGWITSNSWSPQGLGFNGYQWRAKVRDSQGNESDWSDTVWHFTVENDATTIYEFDYINCSDIGGDPDKLCFCADTNAGTLKLQINRAPDGTDNGEWDVINELGVPDYNCDSADDHPPNLDPLPYEAGTHKVRLYARGDGGWANAAHKDIPIYLSSDRRPDAPRLREPENETYLSSRTVHFDWDATLRTTGYQIEASTSPDFSTLLINETLSADTTEYDHTFSTDYETVYWRVTANGPYGANESRSHFHIDVDAPSSSVSALDDVTTDTKFSVNWSGSDARSGLRWYHVQVRSNDRGSGEWKDWLVNTTKTAEMFQAQPGHSYCFRVRAMDEVGNWEYWPWGAGDTCTQVDPSAMPATAWWNSNYAHKRNLIILNNDGDTMPSRFPVHIHFDSTTDPTAAEIYNASLAPTKGDDVRIVYDDQTELDRFIQNFTASQIDIWFPLQVALGGGGTSSGDYQIYYSNAGAGNAPAVINDVFLPTADGNTMGLWHFYEGSGSTVHDSSGRSHDGSFTSAGWTDGFLGYAGRFNGTDAYVTMGNHADFNLTEMTLEAWVYLTDSPDYSHVISKWGGDGSVYFIRIMGDGNVQFQISADGGNRDVVSSEQLEQNRWYHVAGVHDGGNNMWVYVNGIERGHSGDSRTPNASSEPLRIGRDPNWSDTAFPGYIQHVRISDIARHSFPYAKVDIEPSVEAGVSIDPPTQGSPDLAVLDMTTHPNLGGGLLIQAVVQNQGECDTQNNFYTDLYVDHLPAGSGDYTDSIRFWINSPIEAGTTVTLTTTITDLPNLDSGASRTLAALSPGSEITGTLYTQADSTGAVGELDDANNIYASGVEVCLTSPDAYDEAGDDAYETAPLIALNETQSHNFDSLADQDWVKFEAQGGVTYTLYTSDLDDGADTYLYLYDTDGTTLLASNDDHSGTLASRIDWAAPTEGTYYLLVKHWNPNVGGCGTGYQVSLQKEESHPIHTVYMPVVMRNVGPPSPDFSLSLSPSEGVVTQGQSQAYTVDISGRGGFDSSVFLSVNGLPGNTNATWSDNPVIPPDSSLLTVQTDFGTPIGDYVLQVTGRSGSLEHTREVALEVQAGQPVSDGVVLYEHFNYGGRYVAFTESNIDLTDDNFNDLASSLQIFGDYQVILYDHTYYGGTASTFVTSDPDLSNNAVGNDQVSSLQIDPQQTFTAEPMFGTGSSRVVAWGDYDNDDDLDLAVANDEGQNYLYVNQGDTFSEVTQFGTERTWALAWGDYDGDGNLDMAVGNGYGGAQNYLYTNNGDGTFTASDQFNGASTEGLAWGDYDNDSDLDLAVGNEYFQQNYLYTNNGDGTFVQSAQFGISATHAVAWGDCDNDGDLDLAVGNGSDGQNYLFVNNGGVFNRTEAFGTGSTKSLAWADYDGDDDLDLAVGNDGYAQNYLYINDGDGTFTESAQFGTQCTRSIAWGDYDNDGDLDLAVGNGWGGKNYLYLNNGDGTFTPRAEFGEEDSNSVAWGDYDNDGDLDLAVGNGGEGAQNYLYVNHIRE